MNRNVKQQVIGKIPVRAPLPGLPVQQRFLGREQQVVCMPLPHSMPPFHLFHESVPIPGVQGLIMDAWGPIKAGFSG